MRMVLALLLVLASACPVLAAPQIIGPYVGDMRLIQDGERSVVVVISGGLEAATVLHGITTDADIQSGHKILNVKFSWAAGQSGHIRVRLARRNSRTSDITNEPLVSEGVLGKPYAYLLYDRSTPPDLSRLVATIRGSGDWDIAILDYVPLADDPTDADLEYMRQTEYASWVNGRSWMRSYLGPVGYGTADDFGE